MTVNIIISPVFPENLAEIRQIVQMIFLKIFFFKINYIHQFFDLFDISLMCGNPVRTSVPCLMEKN